MRSHPVTLRLSDNEFDKLKYNISCTQMTVSQYVRSLILGITPHHDNHRQEIATQICKLYITLTERGLNEDEALMKEMNELCQILY